MLRVVENVKQGVRQGSSESPCCFYLFTQADASLYAEDITVQSLMVVTVHYTISVTGDLVLMMY